MGIAVAAKLLIEERRGVATTPIQPPQGSGPLPQPMNRESQVRFLAVLLSLLTIAAVVFAAFNFEKERESTAPDDGVAWVEQGGRLLADRVEPNGPGLKAGIKPGDQLVSVNGQDVKNLPGLERQIYRTGVWSKADYSLQRQSVTLDCKVILSPADRSLNNLLRLIALIYLGIGLYVLLPRRLPRTSTFSVWSRSSPIRSSTREN
jgi:two-component system NtrC family sensor kinase